MRSRPGERGSPCSQRVISVGRPTDAWLPKAAYYAGGDAGGGHGARSRAGLLHQLHRQGRAVGGVDRLAAQGGGLHHPPAGLGLRSWQRLRPEDAGGGEDRKSTRLNSSHVEISYAVFCLKKKKII